LVPDKEYDVTRFEKENIYLMKNLPLRHRHYRFDDDCPD
jgi:hypothetical protein